MSREVERLQKTVETLSEVEIDLLSGKCAQVHMPKEQAAMHLAEARRNVDFVLSYSSKPEDLPPAPVTPPEFNAD